MSNKSKNKGKSWERKVCLFLSELYNDSFIRVPNSGAFVGGQNEIRKANLSTEQIKLMRGDIIPPEHYPHCLIECKNYAQFPFHLLGHKTIPLLDGWIEQVEHETTSDNDVWLLLIKVTRKGQYVLYSTEFLHPLKLGVAYKRYWFCEMDYFFKMYKDDMKIRWKGLYGRQTEKS